MNKRLVKIGRNILFMLSIPGIICAFVFADVSTRNEVCKGVQISFANNHLSFVTKQNISDILIDHDVKANKTQLRKIQINELEKAIEKNKWVKNADIFVSADNRIHIRIVQKTPVVRIQPDNDFEEPYYLDEYGNNILYSEQYIPDLPVVTSPFIGYNTEDLALKSDIVKLSKFIAKDTFWNAAITQISIDSNKEFSLIPAFGTQLIILGKVDGLENKMSKLFQFYKQGYHTVRWDKYDEIDLRFERQVVCRNTRGERISVDPYDKTTHKEILAVAKANEEKLTAGNDALNVTTPNAVKVVAAKPAVAKSNNSTAKAKPAVKENTTADKAIVKKQSAKPAADKAVVKSEPKVASKEKSPAKESKPVMTEVQNSKYFNQ